MYVHHILTRDAGFFDATDPIRLVSEFGSPLYLYNEALLRTRCREVKKLLDYENFRVNYSAKTNAGAYGRAMSSNYNCRLRPAEVLVTGDGEPVLIRKRESFADLARHFC